MGSEANNFRWIVVTADGKSCMVHAETIADAIQSYHARAIDSIAKAATCPTDDNGLNLIVVSVRRMMRVHHPGGHAWLPADEVL